jgi:sugar/nucleoside kinase (ribokinase family)
MTKKIIGIGNAIVDILCKVDDEFLLDHNLIKGSMSLIDAETAKKLSTLKAEKITSGGSAGNTIASLGQMGCSAAFIGKIGHDDFGKKFVEEIEKTSARFIGQTSYEKPSAKSFVLVTPDAQRTMCTFLGCASEIDEQAIHEDQFKDIGYLYLEGYLWDQGQTSLALKKAISLAKNHGAKIVFSLSDGFCVSRHKADFTNLVKNQVDIVFCNEAEAIELTSSKSFSDTKLAEFFSNQKHLTVIVTRSEKGCVVFRDGKILEVKAAKVENIIDTTGAGDAFAAGFLKALIAEENLENCANLGNKLAGKIIKKFGARFDDNELK